MLFRSVTFLGQNVNSYRGENGENFRDVLVEASKIQGLERIRFMTSHPKDLTDELIDVMSLDKIMPHIHLPVQSGSSEILKRMNRHYDRERYLEIVDKIYSLNEDIAITTDIIVGFPTETEEDFSKTLDLVRRARFDIDLDIDFKNILADIQKIYDLTDSDSLDRKSVV